MQQGAEWTGGAMNARRQHDVVERGHLAKRPHDLVSKSETAPHPCRGGFMGHVGSAKGNPPAIGAQQSRDDLDQRGLAGSVRPDQADEIALRHGKGHAADGLHAAKADRDVVELKRRAHAPLTLTTSPRTMAARPPGASRITSTSKPPNTKRR